MDISDVRIFTEPQQGASYDDLLAVALRSESLGYGAFFRSDHYLKMGDVDGLPGPTDAWITLAGLARDTSTIRLGTLVTAATFRLPGPLAISVAGVDQMSNGRVELGLGSGWFDAEHTAYGIPFPDLGERFDRFEEQLEIVTGLWNTPEGDQFSFDGSHYTLINSPALPKPAQPDGPPIIIGGRGKHRTPNLAARFATEFNLPFVNIDTFSAQKENVENACQAIGRDPSTMTFSAALVVCCGATEAEVDRRAEAIGREPAELRANGLAGSPDELVTQLHEWLDVGVERFYFQTLDLSDLDHLDLIAESVIPQLAES